MHLTPNSLPSFVGRLLVVDDEENVLHAVCRLMKPGGWSLYTASGAEEGMEVFRQIKPEVVISDYRMGGMDGLKFLSKLHAMEPKTQCIVLTGLVEQFSVEAALPDAPAFRFIFKPWNETQFFLTVQSAFKQHAIEKENEHLQNLTRQQNVELQDSKALLEQKISERTRQLWTAKYEWESTFDTLETPLALVEIQSLKLRRINKAYINQAGRSINDASKVQHCHAFLFGRDSPCDHCPLLGVQQNFRYGEQGLQAEISHNHRTMKLYVHPVKEIGVAICSYHDITEEKAIHQRLAEAEKMVAIGYLSSGVAHELNNPLLGILAFIQLMKREEARSKKDMELLGLMEEGALRCKKIVGSLLRMSRRSRPEDKQVLDLGKCIEDAMLLFRPQMMNFPKAALTLMVKPGVFPIYGDAGQIGQVILNFLQNGLHAFVDFTGSLRVKVGRRGNQCFFSVKDNGVGISEEDLPHIFEPHFTTKPVGQGTGLGLPVAYRIVNEHGGKIEVKSRRGVGTTFRVSFPARIQESERI